MMKDWTTKGNKIH